MRPELRREIDRLLKIFADHGQPLSPVPMVSDEAFEAMEKTTGIVLEPDVKDFYRFFGGRDGDEILAIEIAGPGLLAFRDLTSAVEEEWVGNKPIDSHGKYDVPPRDPRILPGVFHPGWFPLARVSLGSEQVFFDSAPTALGREGQIISYVHDPDEVFYVADTFLEYLQQSNDMIEASWDELFFEGEYAP